MAFPEMTKMQWVQVVWVLFVTICVIYLLAEDHKHWHSESFTNPNDTQYANRYEAGPDGVSLNDRMVAAQNKGVQKWHESQAAPAVQTAGVSGLTGSRDIPVFFQDYDYDMQVKAGNIYNTRENFSGPNKDCGIPGAC